MRARHRHLLMLLALVSAGSSSVAQAEPRTGSGVIIEPNGLSFPAQGLGTESTTRSLRLVNTSSTALWVPIPSVAGPAAGDFKILGGGCGGQLVAPGGECNVYLRFAPQAEGARSAVVVSHIPGSEPSGQSVPISGVGVSLVSSRLLQFGVRGLDETPVERVIFRNVTEGELTPIATVYGRDAADFTLAEDSCSNRRLVPGERCELGVRLAANTLGSSRAGVLLHDQHGRMQDLTVELAADVSGVDFGAQLPGPEGAPRWLTWTNRTDRTLQLGPLNLEGADKGDFRIVGDRCSLARLDPGGRCSVGVGFAPVLAGPKVAHLQINDVDGHKLAVPVPLVGRAVELVEPTALTFGDWGVGLSSPSRTATFRNQMDHPINRLAATLVGHDADDFSLADDTCGGGTIAPGGSCSVSIRFAPGTAGAKSAAVRFAGGGLTSVAVLMARALPTMDPPRLRLDDESVGRQGPLRVVTFTSWSQGAVWLDGPQLEGPDAADFRVQRQSCGDAVVQRDQGCRFAVAFAPLSGGDKHATVVMRDGAGRAVGLPLALTARADGPGFTDRDTLEFPVHVIGTPGDAKAVTFTNLTDRPLVLAAPVLAGADAGDFAVAGCAARVLERGASCVFSVSFSPHDAGPRRAELQLAERWGERAWTVDLFGAAESPATVTQPRPFAPPAPSGAQPSPASPSAAFVIGGRVVGLDRRRSRCAPRSIALKIAVTGAVSVELAVRRRLDVRRVLGPCISPRTVRVGPRRLSAVVAHSFRGAGTGVVTIRAGRRMLGRRLWPGAYQLDVVARDAAGRVSPPASTTILVTRAG